MRIENPIAVLAVKLRTEDINIQPVTSLTGCSARESDARRPANTIGARRSSLFGAQRAKFKV